MAQDSGKSGIDQLRIDRTQTGPTRSRGWIWIILLILLGVGFFFAWPYLRPAKVSVRTVTVQDQSRNSTGPRTVLNASGYVTARRQATVSSKVTGKVVEVLIEEGMKVEQHQILAKLDTSNATASRDLAKAQVAAAQTSLAETKARLDQAEVDLKRATDLAKNEIASQSEVDAASVEAKSLRARLNHLEKEVIVAERQLDLWQQELDDRVIRAPFAGVVVAKNAQPGEMISPMSAGGSFTRTGIGTIVDMSSLEIEVDVNESFINRVEANQPVVATLDAYPDWQVPAKVIAIIPAADRQKATVRVRIGFVELDPRILPDMGVKVAFRDLAASTNTSAGSSVVSIPLVAVRRQDGRDQVWIVEGGRVERRAVTVGAARNDEVIITAGLSAGERVIVEGPSGLSEGDRVVEKQN